MGRFGSVMYAARCGSNKCSHIHATIFLTHIISLLSAGRFELSWTNNVKVILVADGWGISYEITLKWLSLDFTDDKLTWFQVKAWCRQARSHYLSQYCPRSMPPCGVSWPQWVDYAENVCTWMPRSSLSHLKPCMLFQWGVPWQLILNRQPNEKYMWCFAQSKCL